MAKNILVFFVLILLVFSISLPCFAQPVDVSAYTTYFSIWNAYSAVYTQEFFTPETISLVNWADSKTVNTMLTVGLDFPMLPYLTYSVEYRLTSNNSNRIDWLYENPVGNYVLTDAIVDPDLYGTYGINNWRVTPLSEMILDQKHVLGTTFTPLDTVTGNAGFSSAFRVTLMSKDQLSYDYMKLVTMYVRPLSYDDKDTSYKLSLKNVTIYYDPSDMGAATLDQVQKNTQELKDLGIQVEAINTKVDQLSTQVTNEINSVKDQVTNSTNQINNNITAMQESINNSIDEQSKQQHQDSQNTQNAIKDLPGQISDIEQQEGNKASSDANKELGGVTSDLSGKDIDSKSWITKFTDFWNVMGSTNVATEIQLPQFEVFGFVFWESQTIDLAPFFEYCAPLVKLVKFLLTLSVIWAMLRYFYNCVQFALGNSDLTLSSTIFSFNPFKIK